MSKALEDYGIADFVKKTEDGTSYPGGGAISALAGSLGSALTLMAEKLTKDNGIDPKIIEEFNEGTEFLLKNMEKDALAYGQVIQAQKLPRETIEEKDFRAKEIQRGLLYAIQVPMDTAKRANRLLVLQREIAEEISRYAVSDVGVGALLLYTALEGALFNVRINLGSLTDVSLRTDLEEEMNRLLKEGKESLNSVLEKVYGKL